MNDKERFISKVYSQQKEASKSRKHPLPTYTKKELVEWLLNQQLFHYIYNRWVASGCEKMMVPSVDRLDDYKGYSLNNIRITTWSENMKKGHRDRKNGNNRKHLKSVLQYDLNNKFIKEHYSMSEASRKTGVSLSSISESCRGNPHIGRKFNWEYNYEPKGLSEAINEIEEIENLKDGLE